MGRRGRRRKLVYVRLALLVAALVAVLVFHARGSTLVVIRVVRIGLVVLLLAAFRPRR